MKIGEVCTREVLCAGPETTVAAAAKLMRQYHCGDVVVVRQTDGQRVPVGIVTDRDIVLAVTAADLDPAAVTVGDLIGPQTLITAPSSEGLFEAIQRMRTHGIRRMPIVDRDGALAGIVSIDDVIEILAEEMTGLARLIAREQVHEQHARN